MTKPRAEGGDLSGRLKKLERHGDEPVVGELGWELVRPGEARSLDVLEAELIAAASEESDEAVDLELFTETETDVGARLEQAEDEQLQLAAELAGQRQRFQQRLDALREELEARGQLLEQKDAEIEDLAAQLASVTLERDGLRFQLSDGRPAATPATLAEPTAALQSLKSRLEERGRALAVAREEIDRLRADREQLVEGLAERGVFIQELHQRLRALDEAEGSGSDLRRLLARFLGASKDRHAAPAPAPAPQPRITTGDDEFFADEAPIRQVEVRRYLVGLDSLAQVFEMNGTRISIGRIQDNDITIADPAVSRLHAVINIQGRNVTLVDANSRNGTTVNGEVIRHARLRDGDLIGLGSVRLRYRVTSSLEPDAGFGPA